MLHGSHLDPPNRFLAQRREADLEHVAWDEEYLVERTDRRIEYFDDESQSIVSENDSPDIPFRYSANPYRGCAHACPYCYARNTHEYLGLNAGLDFETKIFVKRRAPALLREFLARRSWIPEPITFSGVTDCYQPAEREFRLTRGCLEVARECRQPIGIVTKNALVVRDLDILQALAAQTLVHVNLSITTLDAELARVMEPRTSIPAARLRAIRELSAAGIPVRVLVAPIIPGLNDHEAAEILQAAREAGAGDARYVLLRLPLTVAPVFAEWLARTQPRKAAKIEGLIRQTRGGELNQTDWSQRMVGSGELADQIRNMFSIFRAKYGYGDLPKLSRELFRPPTDRNGQLRLF
ncbi:MAG: PA0069 family radical SAM protein [Pirellulaceae bacterium]|nr:PA0069 family radical SAM protein [Pirellulaceae bacterium]